MFDGRNPEVVVAGAGPVGMFAALALARHGIEVRIVDSGVWACQHSYALALHARSQELFREAGLLDSVLRAAHPVRQLTLCDASGPRASIALDCLAVLRQDHIEELLEKALGDLSVRVQWRHQLARLMPGDEAVEARIDKYEKDSRGYAVAHTEWTVAKSTSLEAPFVIGADGYNSIVRRTLGSEFPEVAPAAWYAVFEFESDASNGNEMRIVLGDRTTDVLWPLPGGLCRWSFQLPDYHDASAEAMKDRLLASGFGYFPTERPKDRDDGPFSAGAPQLDESALAALIAERAPWFTATIGNIAWRTVVRFERRLASSFGQGRLWLAGDSAHLTGPAGIQSMNTGFCEAKELADGIAQALHGGAGGGDLAQYSARWLGEWRRLQGLEGGLHPMPGCDPWVARHAQRLISCLPAHGAALAALAGQLKLAG